MKNMYLEEEMVFTYPNRCHESRFQRSPKFIEIIDQEVRKKAIQMAISNIEKNPSEYTHRKALLDINSKIFRFINKMHLIT